MTDACLFCGQRIPVRKRVLDALQRAGGEATVAAIRVALPDCKPKEIWNALGGLNRGGAVHKIGYGDYRLAVKP